MMASSRNREPYHFKVNPPHLERDLEALKERIMSVTIGAYMRIRISAK